MGCPPVVIDAMTQQNIADDESEQITTETITETIETHGLHVHDETDVEVKDHTHPTVTFGLDATLEKGTPLMAIDYNPAEDMYGVFDGEALDVDAWDVSKMVDEGYNLDITVLRTKLNLL